MSHTANLEAVIQRIGLLGQSQFGKSPESVTIRANEHSVVIFLNELIDPEDERLPDDSDERYTHVYILLDQFVFPAIRKKIEAAADQTIIHHFIDWKEDVNRACIGIMFELEPDRQKEDVYTGKAELHMRVSQITEEVQKTPTDIESFWIDCATLVVIRKGLLISLEKSFIKKGFNNALRVSKRELELERFVHDLPVHALLGKTLDQAFVDWDFANDISLMVLTFSPDQ